MVPFAWLLLLAAPSRVELVNEDYRIAPADWQWQPIFLKQRSGLVVASFHALGGSKQVRLVLMRGEDIEDMPHGALAETEFGESGALTYYLRDLGEYGVVLENRDRHAAADVHLYISLDFAHPHRTVETLPPSRQLSVIVISFAVFFGIVIWSARRLLTAIKGGGP